MSKKRKKLELRYYNGYVKTSNGKWKRKGAYATVEEAIENGCEKAVPQYNRINN